ncbi:MAG: gluconate 2-dehydrogenase subunit 3 family protein [Myxococcota bacterium]|nr:gluconate 2-dehydrogenase subunit 3 family protein [Myxococcota bacterium]
MQPRRPHTRRVFLYRLSFMGGGVVLLGGPGCKKSEDAPPRVRAPLTTSHRSFTNEEFSVLSAACERLIPQDQDPGAVEANVPRYIDRALAAPELRKMKEEFLAGLAALDRRAARAHRKGFHELPVADQDALLTAFKDSPSASGEAHFYELLMALTLEGFLGDPSYGGNTGKVGWQLVGFNTSSPGPGYDGLKHLHDPSAGGGGGGCH